MNCDMCKKYVEPSTGQRYPRHVPISFEFKAELPTEFIDNFPVVWMHFDCIPSNMSGRCPEADTELFREFAPYGRNMALKAWDAFFRGLTND